MVWGMREPNSFGDFFPEGKFVGWDEQLISYYENEMTDAEKAELGMQERILFSQFARKLVADLGPLKLQERPTNYQIAKTHKNLGSMIFNGLPMVEESLKKIIEELEPGVHQFWPITITMPKGKTYPKQYYGLRIARFLDSFSPEKSKEGSWRDGSFDAYWGERIFKYRIEYPFKKNAAGLAMEGAVHKGTHLWREKKLDDPQLFFSDELHDAITSAGLRMPTFYKLKAV